jgi:AbrB family looped-hinge helix DNA binding protein
LAAAESTPIDFGWIYSQSGNVSATITIDKAGRIIIPKEIREELRLEPGAQLTIQADMDHVILRPVEKTGSGRDRARLRKEKGVWVLAGCKPMSLEKANELVRKDRSQREDVVSGRSRR